MKKNPRELFALSNGEVIRRARGKIMMAMQKGGPLPGAGRLAAGERLTKEGIEVPDELLAKIEKPCTT